MHQKLIACKELFYKSDILKENYQKALEKITLFFFRTSCHPCHPYVTQMPFVCHVIRMSLACTRMSSVCQSYVVLPWTIFITLGNKYYSFTKKNDTSSCPVSFVKFTTRMFIQNISGWVHLCRFKLKIKFFKVI